MEKCKNVLIVGLFVLLSVLSSLVLLIPHISPVSAFLDARIEDCHNGKDDDGDGLVDRNDPDCK
jgi:hypothetical protein